MLDRLLLSLKERLDYYTFASSQSTGIGNREIPQSPVNPQAQSQMAQSQVNP